MGEKKKVCAEWLAAESRAAKAKVRENWQAEQLDSATIGRWMVQLVRNSTSPKGQRASKQERRLRGAGRKPLLSKEEEQQLYDW